MMSNVQSANDSSQPFGCRICGNAGDNAVYSAPDLWTSSSAMYRYVECGACGCVQISSYPEDIRTLYPEAYYAHVMPTTSSVSPLVKWLRRQWIDHGLTGVNPLGWLLGKVRPVPPWYRVAGKLGLRDTASVLDVGCGNGIFSLWMARAGFRNVVGIDPYIPEDKTLPEGVRLLRRTVFDETGPYDFITLNHSFEHMPEPGLVLTALRGLLQERGLIMITMPVPGFAWRHYGIYWWNLDSPRHFYLHTPRSLEMLCQAASLKIVETIYSSTYWQFVGSELLQRGLSRQEIENGTVSVAGLHDEGRIRSLKKRADALNAARDGDEAIFFLKKADPENH